MKRVYNYQVLYQQNNETGNVIIDVALNDYLDFYHEWDNTAFRKRDIHPELSNFFDLCSEDIPLRRKIEIRFTIETGEIDADKEDQIRTSYYSYYNSLKRFEKRKSTRHLRMTSILLLLALFLITIYMVLSRDDPQTISSKVMLESLQIGGWVFAWEAIHMIFLDVIDPFQRRRELKRFLNANVSFRYLK